MRGTGRGHGPVGRGGGRGPGGDGDDDGQKPSAPLTRERLRNLAQVFYPYFWPTGWRHRLATISCFVALGLSKLCDVTAPYVLGKATDAMTHGEFPLAQLLGFGILRFGVSCFEEIQRLVYLRVKQAAYHETALSTFRHLHSLSLHWHINKRSGVVLKAMDRGISSASTVVEVFVLRLIPSILEMLVIAIIFGSVYDSPGASISVTIAFIAYFLATVFLAGRRARHRQTMHRADNEATQIAVDSLTGFETVKIFTNEEYELQRYSEAVKAFQLANRIQQASYVTLNITQSFIIRACTVAVLLFAAADVIAGTMTVGGFVALLSYVAQLFIPLSWLGTMYTMLTAAYTDMTNLTDLMQEKADIVDAPNAKVLTIHPSSGATIEFRDVVFQYPAAKLDRIESTMERQRMEDEARASRGQWKLRPANLFKGGRRYADVDLESGRAAPTKDAPSSFDDGSAEAAAPERGLPTIRGISFTVRAGTTTALVGPTGSGKSTISKLLFRFYDVTSGSILVNGEDIRNVTQHSLREHVGMVPQDCVLFNNSIRFNIKYGRPSATDEEMKAAATDAQIATFVESQQQGYDTKVGERGLRLSGGEKQRVAIARTLLKDPPILVLDEATSSLDTVTEAQIQAAIARVRSGRTVLCIAHRLSTIKDADEILVLANGIIEERGTHEQLLALNGRYAALWQQQAAAASGELWREPSAGGDLPREPSAGAVPESSTPVVSRAPSNGFA